MREGERYCERERERDIVSERTIEYEREEDCKAGDGDRPLWSWPVTYALSCNT